LQLTDLGVSICVELKCEHGIPSCPYTFCAFAVFGWSPTEGAHYERANRERLDAADSAPEIYARRHTPRTRTARNASMERKVIEPKRRRFPNEIVAQPKASFESRLDIKVENQANRLHNALISKRAVYETWEISAFIPLVSPIDRVQLPVSLSASHRLSSLLLSETIGT
jgi:hypothetical protein